jgi:hypothetical protein
MAEKMEVKDIQNYLNKSFSIYSIQYPPITIRYSRRRKNEGKWYLKFSKLALHA